MNLPNKLTVFRILLVVVMLVISYIPMNTYILCISLNMWILNIIFVVASLTDCLDGKIARKNNLITDFGKFLDPIADKILVLTAMLILVERQMLPAWIPIIVIIREFVVSGYRLVVVQRESKVIAASWYGKVKTVSQMIAIILAFININNTNIFGIFIHGGLIGLPLLINILTTISFIVAVITTIISGIDYLKDSKELLKDM